MSGDMASVLAEIGDERLRQQAEEGWTTEHDDRHFAGEMARAAAAYAANASVPEGRTFDIEIGGRSLYGADRRFRFGWVTPQVLLWPWEWSWWKPKNPRRDLIKAAALIVAEIERLDRAAKRRG